MLEARESEGRPKTAASSTEKRIYLSAPHLSGEEEGLIVEALRSNWITTLGPQVDQFERELAQYLDMPEAVGLSSGTAAIHLGLRALGVQRGDTILCSTLTFVGSVNPILYEGARPVFVDSDRASWNMCPQSLEKAIDDLSRQGQKPKVAILVNLYGQSARFAELKQICDHHKIKILEDAAESLGAIYHGKKSGSFGDLSILSFNGNKIITTSGGGALMARDPELAKKVRRWSTQAREPAPHYEHSEVGYNYRLSNLLAAVGRAQLKVLEERVRRKREIFEFYQAQLRSIEGIRWMPELPDSRSTRWLTALQLTGPLQKRDPAQIVSQLETANIEARRVWKPMHRQPLFKDSMFFGPGVSDELFDHGLILPSGTQMTTRDLERVVDVFKGLLTT